MVLGGNSAPPKFKSPPPILITSTHIHIPRNSPDKFHNNPMNT